MNRGMRSISLIIGSLLSVAIVCTQLFHLHTSEKKVVKTEQQDSSQPGEEVLYSFTSFSLPSSVQVCVNLLPCILFEILFEESEENQSDQEVPLHPEKLFTTLFRVIISPNAP